MAERQDCTSVLGIDRSANCRRSFVIRPRLSVAELLEHERYSTIDNHGHPQDPDFFRCQDRGRSTRPLAAIFLRSEHPIELVSHEKEAGPLEQRWIIGVAYEHDGTG